MDDQLWVLIDRMLRKCESDVVLVNDTTTALLGDDIKLLKPLSLNRPEKGCAELVFLRTVFWLSALFFECGVRALRFCLRQTQFGDVERRHQAFLDELRALRTWFAHNLDRSSASDVATDAICRNWFRQVCQRESPLDDRHWSACSMIILTKAADLLGKLISFLNILQSEPDSDLLQEGLRVVISAEISLYAFDDIVNSVANDFGRSDLNLQKFRTDHFQKWICILEKLPENCNFLYEARRLVEESFLNNPERPPITGRDIVEILGVAPGREVGRLLEHGTHLFHEGCRQRDALLDQLREKICSTSTNQIDA